VVCLQVANYVAIFSVSIFATFLRSGHWSTIQPMTNPDQLKIAMPVHAAQVVAHALLYDGRHRVRDADAVMARMTAEWLVERLTEAGYVGHEG
jgi:hypothetical protein